MSVKRILKSKRVLAWGITTLSVAALMTTANILATQTFYTIICNRLGGKRAITEAGENAGAYIADYETKEEAYRNGNQVTKDICGEGMVLLKNENKALPLKEGAKVSVFGKNSINLVYGGSGSAAPEQDEPTKTIFDSLTEAGFSYNPTLKSFYEDDNASGNPRPGNPKMENSGVSTLATGETSVDKYNDSVTQSYAEYGDAALVVFSRIAGENWDLPRIADDNPDHHYLQLDNNETALLKHICDSNKFAHVVVLINSSNNIDLGFLKFADDYAYQDKIDAALLIGSPGANGIMALGEILSGKINPSGHTVDTLYTHYENDPTWQNFADNRKKNGDAYFLNGTAQPFYFVDYEEGIYQGYRYYETRGALDSAWYDKNVVYPFGYGLSYTTFDEQFEDVHGLEAKALNATETFEVKVKVKNTGDVAGKDVVQIYASAPYTDGGIEKAYKVLAGFAKTKLLKPNESETVTITINPYDFASFDSQDKNKNGYKGYELEEGDYTFYGGKDAHTNFGKFTKHLDASYRFEKDPVTQTEVKPLFEHAGDHLQSLMSRTDFTGTFPKTPTEEDQAIDQAFLDELNNRDSGNDEDLSVMPKTGADVSIMFKQLVGKDYNDPLWDEFLDQMTFEEMVLLFNGGSYSTPEIERLGIPQTLDCDGPTGIVAFLGTPEVYGTCYYCSEVLLAQTYNVELADEFGKAVGNECILGDQRTDGSHLPYTGWYAPAVNLHRSPFGGRNTEYYSEDSFISGKFAARVIKEVQKKGVYTSLKHFALNDQETHRSYNGSNTWCDEQAMRELYFKPFEIAVKEGKTLGVMSSFNRIGTKWTGGDYNLLTRVLRNEWGFVGSVICDFHTDNYMNNRQMIFAGGDLNLTTTKPWNKADPTAAADVNVLRRATHNTLYAIANSNAMRLDIKGYKLPTWEIVLFAVDGALGGVLLLWGAWAIITALKKKDEVAE